VPNVLPPAMGNKFKPAPQPRKKKERLPLRIGEAFAFITHLFSLLCIKMACFGQLSSDCGNFVLLNALSRQIVERR
jgi:hypothetical protein